MSTPLELQHLRLIPPTSEGQFDGVKVFCATMVAQRLGLGELVTAWIRVHPQYAIVDVVMSQSSDAEFHCVCCSIFYKERQ